MFFLFDGSLTGTNTPGQCCSESNDNERVLHISQSSRTGASPSDAVKCHIEYPHWAAKSYLSAEMQSAYSSVPADWCVVFIKHSFV